MNPLSRPQTTATVPISFVHGMLTGARRIMRRAELLSVVRAAGIAPDLTEVSAARITRAQFVRLYTGLALRMSDEMLGLWSRPIRGGTLKYLGLSLLDAPTLLVALYRFTRFWNLLLDDYQLTLLRKDKSVTIFLQARAAHAPATVFGHELMIKLIHGLASWLAGQTLPIEHVGFGFPQPGPFAEYAALFPAEVSFAEPHTCIRFSESALRQGFKRSRAELLQFVRRAPDDWIFSTFDHASVTQHVRVFVASRLERDPDLDDAAQSLFLSSRSLSRKLAAEGTTFRDVKNGVRRDSAIERLMGTRESLTRIAAQVGFDNLSAFHRAFKAWTGSTPKAYRRQIALAQ